MIRRGAILFAVFKGKVAEGIDFPNNQCRGVFLLGIPYPPLYDPRVVWKKKYLELAKTKVKESK